MINKEKRRQHIERLGRKLSEGSPGESKAGAAAQAQRPNPGRKMMALFVHRLISSYIVVFVAAITLTGMLLFSRVDDSILVPRWRSLCGLGIIVIVFSFIVLFAEKDIRFIGHGLICGLPLALGWMFLDGPHPLHRFTAIREINSDGIIESDEVYFRTSKVVKRFESEGWKSFPDGSQVGVGRYLYSPRIGVLLGKTMGRGDGSPDYSYEAFGLAAWLFGIRAACEQFVFFSINLTPLILIYGLFAFRHKGPVPEEEFPFFDPTSSLLLIGPLVIGVIPLLGP